MMEQLNNSIFNDNDIVVVTEFIKGVRFYCGWDEIYYKTRWLNFLRLIGVLSPREFKIRSEGYLDLDAIDGLYLKDKLESYKNTTLCGVVTNDDKIVIYDVIVNGKYKKLAEMEAFVVRDLRLETPQEIYYGPFSAFTTEKFKTSTDAIYSPREVPESFIIRSIEEASDDMARKEMRFNRVL